MEFLVLGGFGVNILTAFMDLQDFFTAATGQSTRRFLKLGVPFLEHMQTGVYNFLGGYSYKEEPQHTGNPI